VVVSRNHGIIAPYETGILMELFLFLLKKAFSYNCLIVSSETGVMYSLYILTVVGTEGSSPLFYELGCETAYPTSEGLANGVLTWLDNCVGLIFLLILMIPGIGKNTITRIHAVFFELPLAAV